MSQEETPDAPTEDNPAGGEEEETGCGDTGKKSDNVVETMAGLLLTAGAVAAAITNAERMLNIAQREYNLAKKYYNLANNWLNHYKNLYAPVEAEEAQEAADLEHEEPLYSVAEGRARVAAAVEFRGMIGRNIRCLSSYCTGMRADKVMEIVAAQSDALTMAEGLGYRNERAYVETRDDVRFNKILNTIRRGRDMVASNVSFAKAAANIYGDLADQAWRGLEGAGQFLGYKSSRMDTHYPMTMMTNRGERYDEAVPIQHDAHVGEYYKARNEASYDRLDAEREANLRSRYGAR